MGRVPVPRDWGGGGGGLRCLHRGQGCLLIPRWSTMISAILSYGLPSSSGVGELSLGVNTNLNCSVWSLAFVLLFDIRQLPSFSGETTKFSWRLDFTYDQNGLELFTYAHSALRNWCRHSLYKFL